MNGNSFYNNGYQKRPYNNNNNNNNSNSYNTYNMDRTRRPQSSSFQQSFVELGQILPPDYALEK
jgi:hypothetical protein